METSSSGASLGGDSSWRSEISREIKDHPEVQRSKTALSPLERPLRQLEREVSLGGLAGDGVHADGGTLGGGRLQQIQIYLEDY